MLPLWLLLLLASALFSMPSPTDPGDGVLIEATGEATIFLLLAAAEDDAGWWSYAPASDARKLLTQMLLSWPAETTL